MNARLSADELARRRPVWTALSELWLDTDLTDGHRQHIARVLAASGHPPEVLHGIYRDEVAPVVGANLFSPAGVWDAFDAAWLHARAQARAERRWRGPFARVESWIKTRRAEPKWERVVSLLGASERA